MNFAVLELEFALAYIRKMKEVSVGGECASCDWYLLLGIF